MKKYESNIAVVGGGAAGLIAAWRAAIHSNKIILLEKNESLGIKIRISGGGKCNITHGGTVTAMLKQFQKNEERFLRYAFHTFTNSDVLTLLHTHGVETYERENGKVFPKSHNADDVVRTFINTALLAQVKIITSAAVKEIKKYADNSFIVTTHNEEFTAKKVILATGGSSYQKTGTTGDGFQWARNFGHTIIPVRPALAPLYFVQKPPAQWQGVPIRECTLQTMNGNTLVALWKGDVLITHLGISGPAALEVSRKTFCAMESGAQIEAFIDFYPELSMEQLEKVLLEKLQLQNAKLITSIVEQLVPQKLAEDVVTQSFIPSETKAHQIKREERKKLCNILKHWKLGTIKEIPLDRGEVTAGGIHLEEVSPTTMESKLVKGLYLCGEILDIAGPVGGYNLQAAFSTGFVAGEHAGKSLLEEVEIV